MTKSLFRRVPALLALVFTAALFVAGPAVGQTNGSNGSGNGSGNGSNGSGTPTTQDTTATTQDTTATTAAGGTVSGTALPSTGTDFALPLAGGAALVGAAIGARHLARKNA